MRISAYLGVVCLSTAALLAQSADSFTQFTVESVLDLNQLTASTNLSLSQSVVDSVQGGGSELRQQVTYDPSQKLLHVTGFEAAAGSPLPTASIAISSTLWAFDVRVDDITLNNGQSNSVVMTGTFLTGQSPFEGIAPTNAVVSFTFVSNGGDADFQGISVSLVGAGATFAASGKGKVGVTKATVTAVASPRGAVVTSLDFTLDGRKSTSSAGGALVYKWQFLPAAGQTAQFTGDDSAVLKVSLQPGDPFVYGDYTFRLTVTSSTGASASDTVTITVVNPNE